MKIQESKRSSFAGLSAFGVEVRPYYFKS